MGVMINSFLVHHILQNHVDEEDIDEEDHDEADKSHDSHHGAPEYRRLIAIDAGKPKGGIDECLKVDPDKVRRLSLSEQQLEKISATHGKEIVRYQRIFISFFFLVV